MYAAKIELGWVNKWFKGENAYEILKQLEVYQDFDCLLRMGRMHETKKGQKELAKLETLIGKLCWNTMHQMANLIDIFLL